MKQVLINSCIILMVLFIWTCGDNINSGNEILSLTASDSLVEAGGSVLLVCTAVDEDGEIISIPATRFYRLRPVIHWWKRVVPYCWFAQRLMRIVITWDTYGNAPAVH